MVKKVKIEKEDESNHPYLKTDKFSIENLRRFYKEDGIELTDEQLNMLRTFLLNWLEIILNEFHRKRLNEELNNIKPLISDEKTSDFICESEYRRAS